MITDKGERKLIEFADKEKLEEQDFATQATHLTIINLMSHTSCVKHFTEYAKDIIRDHEAMFGDVKTILTPTDIMAQYLHNFFGEQNPLAIHRNVYSDVLMLALGYIDWKEVADRFIDKAKEE